MIAIIDADSMVYALAWIYREYNSEEQLREACDNTLREILTITDATSYIGYLSPEKCFRHEVYQVQPYKGKRDDEKPEWYLRLGPILKDQLMREHGFLVYSGLEADDMVIGTAQLLRPAVDCIVVSPDKDLRQIPGRIAIPPKGEGKSWVFQDISEEQAQRNIWMQMLCGDTSDNICGIPGIGEKKANDLLNGALDPIAWGSSVLSAYCKYYGSHYGNIIYQETLCTVLMMQPGHPLWDQWQHAFQRPEQQPRTLKPRRDAVADLFDIS